MSLFKPSGGFDRAAEWGELASELASALSCRISAPWLELSDDFVDSCVGTAVWVAEGVEGTAGLAGAKLRSEGALQLFLGDALPGRQLLTLAAAEDALTSKVVTVWPLVASALLPGVHGKMASHLLSLASASVPLSLLLLPVSGMLCLSAVEIYSRVRVYDPSVYTVAAFSLGLSAASYFAMAVSGPVVVTLPAEWFTNPCLVWPVLQDIFVIPMQLVTLYGKAGLGVSSAAPAVVFATLKAVAAVGMTVVNPYGNLCRLVGWSSLGLLAMQLQELTTVGTVRVVAISDLEMCCGLLSLLTQTIGVDHQMPLYLMATCDSISKIVVWHLLVKPDPGAAWVEEEPMAEPPPEMTW